MQSLIGNHRSKAAKRRDRTLRCLISFYTYERVQEIVAFIQKKVSIKPEIAIICGSGLGGLAELILNKTVIPYTDIPHFPKSTGKFYLSFG